MGMVDNIRKVFKELLDELDWMDDVTRAKAHLKADQMTPHVAYAKEILDDDLINEFYDGLNLETDSYLKNYLRLKKFINLYYAKEYRKKIDKKDWRTHGGAAIVNAFYNPEENSIQFPAGILGGLFFDAERPAYMNYGAIGFVVGHEITHGFDDQGSQRDGDGNLVDWWEASTKEKYLEKAKCIIDQYGAYKMDVEGETLNVWCSIYRPAALKQQVLTDPHSPAKLRVNVPFANLDEFAQDWNCPVGSPMNPVKKCSVW